KSIAVTNQRCFFGKHKMAGGVEFEIYHFSQVHTIESKAKAGDKKGTFSLLLQNGERIDLEKIPILQLSHLVQLANELLAYFQQVQPAQPIST
ncbi:MAG: hypothetical protein AAF357_18885, partial [Verrucomicrobiota bacterium]